MAYLGLDIGTTSCKASLIDDAGSIVYSAAREYDLLFPGGNWIEICPDTVWAAVCSVLSDAGKNGGYPIEAISIASFGESVVLLDDTDTPLGNSIFYTDMRGTEEIRDILSAIPEEMLYHITGMPLNSMYSLNKLLWIKKHQPDLLKKTIKIFLYGDYIGYKLTGERYIDYSLASRTMMLDIDKKKWSKTIFDTFGLDRKAFSTPAQAGKKVGIIKESLSGIFGFGKSIPLVLGGHDQACAALGAGAVRTGDCCDSFGSAECCSVVIRKKMISDAMRKYNFCCEPHLIPGKYITLAFNTSAGASLKWYRNTIEQERYLKISKEGGQIYSLLDSECSAEPTSILFFPYLAGSGTPSMDSSACGAFAGLKASTPKPELYKAIMEGICFDLRYNLELLKKAGIPVKNIHAVGGGSRSETLLQIKTDIFGIPVKTQTISEAGTLGLAILCASALGDFADHATAIRKMIQLGARFNPIQVNREIYDLKYLLFKEKSCLAGNKINWED